MSTSTPSRSSTKASARERARAQRIALDVERARRDEQIEAAAAGFYEATDNAESLREQIRQNEVAMTRAVQALIELKERPERIQSLLGIDAAELRRLKPPRPRAAARAALHMPDTAHGPESDSDGTEA